MAGGAYKLLDTVFSGGTIKSNVGERVDARYPAGADGALKALNSYPENLSEQQYWQEEEKMGELALTALLTQAMVKTRAAERSSLLKIRGAILSDKQGQMKTAFAMGQQELKFNQTAITHNILAGGQQKQMSGYAAAASGVRSLI
jgi:hypothetical protein